MNKYFLSIACPAYNEEAGIRAVILEWINYLILNERISDFEIVICNDGSSDGTGSLLDSIASGDRRIIPIHLKKNQGAAVALSTAIGATKNELVLLQDSDGQFPIKYLDQMLDLYEEGKLAVIGVRARKKEGIFGTFGTWASAYVANFFFGSNLRDFNSAFKLVNGDLLRSLTLEAKGLNYSTEVTAKIIERSVRFGEIDIEVKERIAGKSSMKFLRDSIHRFYFVMYLGLRQFLIKRKVLQIQEWHDS